MYTAALLYIQQHIIYGHGKKILRRCFLFFWGGWGGGGGLMDGVVCMPLLLAINYYFFLGRLIDTRDSVSNLAKTWHGGQTLRRVLETWGQSFGINSNHVRAPIVAVGAMLAQPNKRVIFICCTIHDAHFQYKDAAENLVKGHGRTLSVKEPWTESHVVVVAQCEICFLEKGPSVVAAPRGHDYQLTLTLLIL
ncbi:hypothetical protein ACJX0J_008474 [Zea mays]